MDFSEACATEVEALHDFIEDWFAGRVTEDEFDRMEQALSMDFEMITPASDRRGREDLLDGMRGARGTQAASVPPFEISIENVETRGAGEDLCLVTYEEIQRSDGDRTGRLSTALFRKRDDAPNGVEWVHIHETWTDEPE